jgi:ABC-type branched-subunit amino acid transport system permease subunit
MLGGLTVPPLFGASQLLLSLMLILFIIYRPSGLFGTRALRASQEDP